MKKQSILKYASVILFLTALFVQLGVQNAFAVEEEVKKVKLINCYSNADDSWTGTGNSCVLGGGACTANGCPAGTHSHNES